MVALAKFLAFLNRSSRLAMVFSAGLAGGTAISLTVQSRAVPVAHPPVLERTQDEKTQGERTQGKGSATFELPATLRAPNSAFRPNSPIPADVLRVLDGDTFEARVLAWPGLEINTMVRLRGIEAPELRARCPMERIKAEAARDALTEILSGSVGVYSITADKLGGRVVADAATHSIASVAAEMLRRGHARPITAGHRNGWCDR